jgi:alpha-beta hydrolase superfamily lysophospholipase
MAVLQKAIGDPVKWLKRWAVRAVLIAMLAFATLIVGGAYDARWRLPELSSWHRLTLDDLKASDLGERFTLAHYRGREEQLFSRIRAFEAALELRDRTPVNRYHPGSLSHPLSAGRDWNRSFESEPPTIRAGALLLHGLTDSPYSMRAVADVLRDNGVYSLALRRPGHGTVPSGLVHASWQDWLAAVRAGVRFVKEKIPKDAPIILVGYSNGGALVLKYTFDAIERAEGTRPAQLILLSPMIGVTPAARLAWWISLLGAVPYFEKANWVDVVPEFNPFKYNSFSANAAFQTASLTRAVQASLTSVASSGRLREVPPILTFQSIVDATVSTAAVVHTLYDRLPANGSELVLFDVNHLSGIDVFVRADDRSLVTQLFDQQPRQYRRILITNASTASRDVEAQTIEAGASDVLRTPLGLAWPREVFSLTHVAIPFPVDDPLYGIDGSAAPAGLLPIGRLSPRGERAVLTVGTDTLMRLSSNPFFPYVKTRINGWMTLPPPR